MSAPAVEKDSLARWKHAEEPVRERRRRSNVGRWLVALLALVLIAVLAAVAYATFVSTSGSALASKMITAEVKSSDLLVTVTEDGNLESASNVELKCEVAGGSTILSIVADGTMVKKGDELVRLDSATIEDNVNAQKILVAKAEAAKITAESTWSAAKIAVQEYLEGTFVQEKQTLEANMKVAEENLRSAQNTLAFSDRMLRKGYVTQLQRDSHAFAVERAKLDLANAETALNVLEKYTKEKMLEDLTSARDSAEAQMNSELATYEMESAKLERLETQMKKCILIAPQDGMVVYANDDAGWGQQAPKVELGAAVKEYQSIIRLPDLSNMQVKVLVHESKVDAIRRGLRARIKIQDRVLQGTVTAVASQPEPAMRWMGNIKEYATLVKIDGEPEALKPGMTADVTILVDQRKDVVSVPVQCVVERGRKFYAWIRKPSGEIERRELVLGATNDTNIEIKDGLNAGDRVLQNPRSQLAEAREGANVDEPVDVQKTFGEAAPAMAGGPAMGGPGGAAGDPAGPGAGQGPMRGGPGGPGFAGGPGGPAGAGGPGVGPGGMGPGEPGGRAGGRRFMDFTEMDKDKDGKLSKEEFPEQARDFFDRNDTNGDGFIDKAENDAMMARMRQMRSQGGFGGPGGGAPAGGRAPGGSL